MSLYANSTSLSVLVRFWLLFDTLLVIFCWLPDIVYFTFLSAKKIFSCYKYSWSLLLWIMLQWTWKNRCLFKILVLILWINIWDSVIWNPYKTGSRCNCWAHLIFFHTADNALHCLMSGVQNFYHICYVYHLFSFVLSEGVNLISFSPYWLEMEVPFSLF